MKAFILMVALTAFLMMGSNTENVWAREIYDPLSEPVVKEKAEEGYPVGSGRMYFDLGVQFGHLDGDTTYRISFDGGESELEFPLDIYLFGGVFGWGYKNAQKQEKMRLEIRWLTDVSDGKEKMKDSDWFDDDASVLGVPGYSHPGKDIYSESDIKLKARVFDVNLTYSFWPVRNVSIGPMAGYRHQFFDYDVSNTNQIGYDLYAPSYTASVRGRTLEYEVTYRIPYFGLNSNLLLGKRFRTNLSFCYAPRATADDKDDHVLRYKLSEANADGHAYISNLNVNWNVMAHLHLSLGGEYMKIHTTGTQHQSFYGGPYYGVTYNVDDKITSSQLYLYGVITYRF